MIMKRRLEKIAKGVIILIGVITLIEIQRWIISMNYGIAPFFRDAVTRASVSIIWAFILGLLFGLITCPVCGVPLAAYVITGEGNVKNAALSSILFNGGRLVIFSLFGIIAVIFSKIIPPWALFLGYGLSGFIMILLSADLFGVLNIREYSTKKVMNFINKHIFEFKTDMNHPVEYFVWGSVMGIACSAELIWGLLAVWINSITVQGFIYTFMMVVLFGIGVFIPPTILVAFAGGSVELTCKYAGSNIRTYVRYIGSIFLLYLGISYISLALHGVTIYPFLSNPI